MRNSTSAGESFAAELVEQALRYVPTAVILGLLVALLMVAALWPSADHTMLLCWLAVVLLISSTRMAIFYHYHRSGRLIHSTRIWIRWLSSTVLISSATWGCAGLLFFSTEFPQNNIILAFTLGGTIAAASSSLSPMQKTMRTYAILQMSPIILKLFFVGTGVYIAMGIMLIFYITVCMLISAQIHKMLLVSLGLRRENIAEIEERKKAEEELRRHKEELEEIVKERTEKLRATNENLSSEITERKQAEKKLRVSEERFRGLVESSSDLIWEIDSQGFYTYISPKVEMVLGYNVEEITGRTFFNFMVDIEAKRIQKIFTKLTAKGKPISGLEKELIHKNGNVVILESYGEPIKSSRGNILGYRGVDRDITERKKMTESLQQKRNLESIGLLAGGIAHDFNNLLVVIFGNITMAQERVSEKNPAWHLLEQASQAMENAKKLTAQLLTFAKGGDPLKKAINMQELVEETCRLVLNPTNVRYEVQAAKDLWPAEIDKVQMWQVLQNLLVNATDAMPAGGLIRICAENSVVGEESELPLSPGSYIKLAVTDQGVGIKPSMLTKIFEPYFSTRHENEKRGKGLGLAICRSIIKKHNGHIFATSVHGEGATFTFYLPASKSKQTIDSISEQPRAKLQPGKTHVLLLDDESSVLDITKLMLSEIGVSCTCVQDGAAAVELYKQAKNDERPFDLVILDLTIRGGMGGEKTLKQLLKINPKVKAIVASGYADNKVISQYNKYGFKAAIAKPYNLAQLEKVIHENI